MKLGTTIRHAGRELLATALVASRRDTLETFAQMALALAGQQIPQRAEFNPLLWELGHIGWFQEYWLMRNPQRHRGAAADPLAPRPPSAADAWYDSSHVPHDTRWALPLPSAEQTQNDLALQLDQTLALLKHTPEDDDALYFFRLVLLHEDMHHEAALYAAQALGLPIKDPRWQVQRMAGAASSISFGAGPWQLGYQGNGFAFDNELQAHAVALPAFDIDSRVLRWADYMPFVEATGIAPPRYLRHTDGAWQCQRWGRWHSLDPALPACHLTAHEALAWCAWAGRRLPTEAEWERAAIERPDAFEWGQVWEWTASTFAPYAGFVAHPYRDYSAPWFSSRPVLRGASVVTQPRMRHPRYRNYFTADRNDIFAGFRSCAV